MKLIHVSISISNFHDVNILILLHVINFVEIDRSSHRIFLDETNFIC